MRWKETFSITFPQVLCSSGGAQSLCPNFAPPTTQEWKANPPSTTPSPCPPPQPSHHEPAINIWKRSAGRHATLCSRSCQRHTERQPRLPNISNNANSHLHVWPLAEIILADAAHPPPPPHTQHTSNTSPRGMPAISQGHFWRCRSLRRGWQSRGGQTAAEKTCLSKIATCIWQFAVSTAYKLFCRLLKLTMFPCK